MVSPQNLAIGAAAVGTGRVARAIIFRRVVGWSLLLPAGHVRARVPAVDVGAVVDGGLTDLIAELRGDRRRRAVDVHRRSTSCARTSPTGCCRYQATAGRGGAARQRRGGAGLCVQRVRARRACRGWRAGRRLRALPGGALPVVGRRADRRLAAHAHPATMDLREPARLRRAGRHQRVGDGGGSAGLLLSPGPVEPDRLLDRRQRGGERRRRALPEIRLHYARTCWGLEVVLPDGRWRTRRSKPSTHRATISRRVFVGSEGTLGVATKVITAHRARGPNACNAARGVRLHATTPAHAVSGYRRGGGCLPAAIEMMDTLSIEAAEAASTRTIRCAALLLVELDGPTAGSRVAR